MKKPNPVLAKIEAQLSVKYHKRIDTVTQMCCDAAMIAANEVLKLGPGRAKAFHTAYVKAVNQLAGMVDDDAKYDPEFVYAKTKIDEKIRSIVGDENFDLWEKRYG